LRVENNGFKFTYVRVSFDSIEWANKLDLDPKLLYSKRVEV